MFGFTKLFTIAALLATSVVAAPIESAAPAEKRTVHTGTATYFEVGLGACGWSNSNTDYIVALNEAQYSANSGANCGQQLTITNSDNGKTVVAYVADECPGCASGSLDMSPSLFEALATGGLDEGVFPIEWHFKARVATS